MPFITVMDTVFEGRISGWRNEDSKPIVFDTREEAFAEANDEELLAMGNDPDEVVEVVVTDEKIYDPIDGRIYWSKGEEL